MRMSFFKEKKEYIITFLLGCSTMFLCLLFGGLIIGDQTILESDLSATYVPAMRSFVRNLLSGNVLYTSWDYCLGSNSIAYNAYYIGGSIANLLYIIFSGFNPEIIVIFVILLKAGLTSVCFFYFMERFGGKNREIIRLFSLFYAMCSYQIFINTINIIWMDAAYLLPFVLGLLVEFRNNHKWKSLCLAYVYMFLANFYMAYMVGIFSAIFFLLLVLTEEKRNKIIKSLFEFSGVVLLAVCISAVVLLPTGLYILGNSAPDSTTQISIEANVLHYYCQLFLGANGDVMYTLPCLYTGIPTLLLFPFFFFCIKEERRKKWILGILLGIMVVSSFVPLLYAFWHVFDAPDGWPYRFAFIISFLLCVIGCLTMEGIQQVPRRFMLGWIGINIIIYVGCLCFKKNNVAYISRDYLYIGIINIAFLFIWFIYLFINWKKSKKYIIYIAMAELVINGYYMLQIHERPSREEYRLWYETGTEVSKELEKETGLYRVNIENDKQFGTDMFFGFFGIGDFGTMENYEVRQALGSLGVYASPRITCSAGVTPFAQLILGIKYNIPDMYVGGQTQVVECYSNYLNIGFLVDGQTENVLLTDHNIYENSNLLASAMFGENIEIFMPVTEEKVTIKKHGIEFGQTEDGCNILYSCNEPEELSYMTFHVPDEGKEVYCTFDTEESIIDYNNPFVIDGQTDVENNQIYDYKRLGVRYAQKLEQVGQELVLAIGMRSGLSGQYMQYNQYWLYQLQDDHLYQFYEKLKKQELEVDSFKNGYIHGKIVVENPENILFTSIPYDEGWKVSSTTGKVDTIPLLGGAFLGVRFETKGEHILEFHYTSPGYYGGIICTVIGLSVFGVLCIMDKRKKWNRSISYEK